ncbi:hypothetical protein [Mangrovicoccus algicola]|uniref:Uncharacterized protein n=1 Tax=Mangrovicoccus algicola TaxID=2771008 RepID=A0A8J7CVT6_9RHOB|nr:hypothetical protein [Mangrovicoccus algicola]MBE3639119.1 hypothetical protein [Mangrovicoccus algicola]
MSGFFRSAAWQVAELVAALILGPALVLHGVWMRRELDLAEAVALLCFLGLGWHALAGRRGWAQALWLAGSAAAITGATLQWGRVAREAPWLRDIMAASIGW